MSRCIKEILGRAHAQVTCTPPRCRPAHRSLALAACRWTLDPEAPTMIKLAAPWHLFFASFIHKERVIEKTATVAYQRLL